tara:strand:+ start:2192 stop:2509 length:318 start_codon:yes stop_codon:yes gene_type:complete
MAAQMAAQIAARMAARMAARTAAEQLCELRMAAANWLLLARRRQRPRGGEGKGCTSEGEAKVEGDENDRVDDKHQYPRVPSFLLQIRVGSKLGWHLKKKGLISLS